MHGAACSGVRQQRAEEAVSEAEAVKRWLANGDKLNFQKIWRSNVDASQTDTQ
jgi:hypothetical protein